MKLRATVLILLATITVDAQSIPTFRTLVIEPALSYTPESGGGTFDETQIEKYPLYCDGRFILDIPNDFTRRYVVDTALLGAGDHTCAVSEVVGGIESVVSATVTFPLGQRTPGTPTLTVE